MVKCLILCRLTTFDKILQRPQRLKKEEVLKDCLDNQRWSIQMVLFLVLL